MTDAAPELEIERALQGKKDARRLLYSDPSSEAKDAFKRAAAEYDRVRLRLDPEYRKARNAAQRKRWAMKNLGG